MDYKTIICGVTWSEASQKAALEAARLAKENKACLIYVYAVNPPFLAGMAAELNPDFGQEILENLGKKILERAEEISLTEGITPKKILRPGAILEVLKQVLAEEKADLLVISHQDRSFFEKGLLRGEVEDPILELILQTGVQVKSIL